MYDPDQTIFILAYLAIGYILGVWSGMICMRYWMSSVYGQAMKLTRETRIEQPVMDKDGKPVFNKDGKPVMATSTDTTRPEEDYSGMLPMPPAPMVKQKPADQRGR